MHELPKMQHFHWFSFWQVDEENNGKTKFMPISVKLNQTYGSRSSAKCQVLWHCVSWLGTWVSPLSLFFPLFSSPAPLALLSPGQWQSDTGTAAGEQLFFPCWVTQQPGTNANTSRVCSQPLCVLGWELGFQTEWGFKENEPKAGRSLVALN